VLVSSSTHRITEDFFEYSFLGTHAIKGLPFDAPRSLTPDQVYAVCAYVLFLNHLVPEGAVLDAASLPKIEMPNRAGFVSAYPPRSENPAPWLNPPTWNMQREIMMIVDLRSYTMVPGRLNAWLKLYEAEGLPIHIRHLGEPMGIFTTDVGTLNQVVFFGASRAS